MAKHGYFLTSFVIAIASTASGVAPQAHAQTYPVKPIRMVVGFPIGVGSDTTARMVAQKLSEALGQSVVVENRPGAAGAIATERVVTSPPDGYTLMMMTASETIRPAFRSDLPYDARRDLTAVTMVAFAPYVLLRHPSVPAHNLKELIALARSRPGKLTYGSTGVGSTSHLAGELFNSMARVKTLMVSYKGSTDSAVATASGQVDMSFSTITAVLPLLDSGRLRPVAITSTRRSSLMPSTPTMDESGLPGYRCVSWFGVVGPAGLPRDIVERVSNAIAKTGPDMKAALNKQGIDIQTNSPEQFATLIREEIEQNIRLVKSAGMKTE